MLLAIVHTIFRSIIFSGVTVTRCTAVKVFAATLTAVVGVLCWSVSAFCQVQVNQNFLPQGPSPATGTLNLIGSTDNFPNGTASGAIEAIVTDPTNANLYYIGTPNGGIWKTTNGGTNWTH